MAYGAGAVHWSWIPSRCPAVLDTTSWDPRAGVGARSGPSGEEVLAAGLPSRPRGTVAISGNAVVHPGSHASVGGRKSRPRVAGGRAGRVPPVRARAVPRVLGGPFGASSSRASGAWLVHPADMPMLARYLRAREPAQGAAGTRLRAPARHRGPPHRRGLAGRLARHGAGRVRGQRHPELRARAEPARRSARGPTRAREPPLGFGSLAEGHTGSTFEGLLHAGVHLRTQVTDVSPLRGRRRPHPGEARRRGARAGAAR